jgi:hypothetical protein
MQKYTKKILFEAIMPSCDNSYRVIDPTIIVSRPFASAYRGIK